MANCDYIIATNIAEDCSNPMVQGLKPLGYIGNFDDIAKASCVRTGNKITTLALKENASLVKVYQAGKTPFNGTNTALSAGDYKNKFNKTVNFVVFDNGADATENIIDKLANGKFFFIIENNYQGASGDGAFEVVGFENGASASEITNTKYDDNAGGAWVCSMVEENAPTSGVFYLASGGVDATRTAIEALAKA